MKIRKSLAALSLLVLLPTTVACSAEAATTAQSSSATQSSTARSDSSSAEAPALGRGDGGPGGGVDPSSVTTEEELVALIQDAYGDGGLGLHRGHQPVEAVLDEVLAITHDELHVRMEEQGQNLAAVATDLGIDPQTLVDALVESRSSALDNLLDQGTITQDESDDYRAALEAAFTFRVNWDGEAATPTFSGLDG